MKLIQLGKTKTQGMLLELLEGKLSQLNLKTYLNKSGKSGTAMNLMDERMPLRDSKSKTNI